MLANSTGERRSKAKIELSGRTLSYSNKKSAHRKDPSSFSKFKLKEKVSTVTSSVSCRSHLLAPPAFAAPPPRREASAVGGALTKATGHVESQVNEVSFI